LAFKRKQYDGPYEISEIEIQNEGEIFRGLLYFPPKAFKKPYSLIIYFHGFPQLFTFKEIVKEHSYLLDMGYAFLVFNFRGYRFSEGKVSIKSQVFDSLKIIEFVKLMDQKSIINLKDTNLIAHDFGAYIALLVSSKTKLINKILLISPIINLKKHVYSKEFAKTLAYINRFLVGNVIGIENIDKFIEMTKKELNHKEFQINESISRLKINEFKIIIGENDKITPLTEIESIKQAANITPSIFVIKGMDHECMEDNEIKKLKLEIQHFFKR